MLTEMTQNIWTHKRIQYGAGLLALAGLFGAAWTGYAWYKRSQEQAAYKDLAQSIDGYVKVRAGARGSQNWVDVEKGFQAGAQRNASSNLQPYFLIYQADALAEQGKQKEAATLLDQALTKLDRSNPVYYLYAIKNALIKIDSSDAALEKKGREELSTLVQDKQNPLQDMARYYLGLDALSQGDTANAEKFLRQVGQESTVWYKLAQDTLGQL